MSIFFTADQHFGHERIIELSGRPFGNVYEMDQAIIANWNAVVGHDDTVYVLGDFAMGEINTTLRYAASLNGHKILIAGNHDRVFPDRDRWYEWVRRYHDVGFEVIAYAPMTVSFPEIGAPITLSHFPYRGDSGDIDRFVESRPVDSGNYLLCGHVHERWRRHGHMLNVGVDVWDFQPVPIIEIVVWHTEQRVLDEGVFV